MMMMRSSTIVNERRCCRRRHSSVLSCNKLVVTVLVVIIAVVLDVDAFPLIGTAAVAAIVRQRHHPTLSSRSKVQSTVANNNQDPLLDDSFVVVDPARNSILLPKEKKDVSSSSVLQDRNNTLPRHIAFICDGNSRWATARGLPAVAGHAAGADRLWDLLHTLGETPDISHCTLYTFSTENWKRPSSELNHLWKIMEQTARALQRQNTDNAVCIRLLGDTDDSRIPASLRTVLAQLEMETAPHSQTVLTVSLAINYGGRHDIVQAAQKLVAAAAVAEEGAAAITEDSFSTLLGTHGMPDPDLIVRTSGETRLSNFMLWNAAYAELYFTDILWPDFGPEALNAALEWYQGRKRRFGGRKEDEPSLSEQ